MDRNMTLRMRRALELIDVQMLDHLIVGKTILSMRERGMM
jgi:DNA repair protein RadC